jgi:hypothetical protein
MLSITAIHPITSSGITLIYTYIYAYPENALLNTKLS